MKTYLVRINCEYSTTVQVQDNQDEDDAMGIASRDDVESWDKSWSEMEAEEEVSAETDHEGYSLVKENGEWKVIPTS